MGTRVTHVAMAFILAATGVLVADREPAAGAIGPYTLPFFYPYAQTQDYGCTGVTSNPWRGSPWNCYFHTGIDYALPMSSLVASSDNGTSDAFQEWVPNGGSDQYGGGNYLFLKHGTNLYSLYYHLKYNGVIPSSGTGISEGQHIAYSGDTGAGPAHLHYQLGTDNVIGCNPYCDSDPRLWTTSPGRVPWRADYVREHSASGYSVMQYSQWTTWVELKNIGGRPWRHTNDGYGRGRVYLAAVASSGSPQRNSSFWVSGDWSSEWLVGPADQNPVNPDGIGRFTFKLYARYAGSYNEYFNLRANSLWWFNYSDISGFYIPISVAHCC